VRLRRVWLLPVSTAQNLTSLRDRRIHEFSVRLATPNNLETTSGEQTSVRRGMIELMGPNISTEVEVSYQAQVRGDDIRPGPVERLTRWLRREKENDRGGISAVEAKGHNLRRRL
jgi:hypothetical protein